MAFLSKGNALTSERWKRGVPKAAHVPPLPVFLQACSCGPHYPASTSVMWAQQQEQEQRAPCEEESEPQSWAVALLGPISHPKKGLRVLQPLSADAGRQQGA